MPRINFDETGKRFYYNGVSECALFVKSAAGAYGKPVAWNGISNATVTPDGGDANDIYADNIKYLSIPGAVNINASITAYTYPDEFNECMGLGKYDLDPTANDETDNVLFAQQDRAKFGLVWKSRIGNDNSSDIGYVLNILYNCLATPTEMSSDTVNESPEAAELSFDISTVSVATDEMPGDQNNILKPTSWVRITCKRGGLLDNDGKETTNLAALLDILYGNGANATLLSPKDIYAVIKTGTVPNA